MAATTVPLQDLAQRITQQEAQLADLRKEYEARQGKLAELNHRKAELQQQLNQVESEIEEVDQKGMLGATPAASTTITAATDTTGLSMPKFLVHVVQEAGRPLTMKELAQEVVRRNFPTTSKDIFGMVETRVSELVRNGFLTRTPDKTLIPGPDAIPAPKAPKSGKTSRAKLTVPPVPGRKTSLKELLAEILGQSDRPLSTTELADRVLGTGYTTKSTDFKNVIWVCVGKMPNVKNIRGEGYVLKRRKRAAAQ